MSIFIMLKRGVNCFGSSDFWGEGDAGWGDSFAGVWFVVVESDVGFGAWFGITWSKLVMKSSKFWILFISTFFSAGWLVGAAFVSF